MGQDFFTKWQCASSCLKPLYMPNEVMESLEVRAKVSTQKGLCLKILVWSLPLRQPPGLLRQKCTECQSWMGKLRVLPVSWHSTIWIWWMWRNLILPEGIRWHCQDKECKQFCTGKNFPFLSFCAKNVTVSSCSVLNTKPAREKNLKEKVKHWIAFSIGWIMFRSYKTC